MTKRLKLNDYLTKRAFSLAGAIAPDELEVKLDGPQLQSKAFYAWSNFVKEHISSRKQDHRRKEKLDDWITRARIVREQRQMEQQLIDQKNEPFTWVARAD